VTVNGRQGHYDVVVVGGGVAGVAAAAAAARSSPAAVRSSRPSGRRAMAGLEAPL